MLSGHSIKRSRVVSCRDLRGVFSTVSFTVFKDLSVIWELTKGNGKPFECCVLLKAIREYGPFSDPQREDPSPE